jgi:plasmid stabilization system protein ParE
VIIVWSPRAIAHVAELRAYIARDNPNAAHRVGSTLVAAVERLAELPNLGRAAESPVLGNWWSLAHHT